MTFPTVIAIASVDTLSIFYTAAMATALFSLGLSGAANLTVLSSGSVFLSLIKLFVQLGYK